MHSRTPCRLARLTVVCLLLSHKPLLSAPAAQADPLELQRRAIQRIDLFIDHFRKTGDFKSLLPDLSLAATELTVSNRMLAANGDWSALALGLIKQGHTYRMQAQWQEAIALYQQAEEAATRGKNVVQQSDAIAWRALAESSRRNLGQAHAAATQAVRLAETTIDKDVLARALDVLGSVQIAQLDLAGAADTLNREVTIASQAKDPTTGFYAYLSRSDVYLKVAEQCDFQRGFEPCYEALDRARADLQQALAIVRRLGYMGLVRQTETFIKDVETRRGLIKSQESMRNSVQQSGVFRPKTRTDVLVTDKFVASPGAIPPALTEIYETSLRLAKQAGGLADIGEARIQFIEGMINERRGNNDAALAFFLKAVESLERDRRPLLDERSRGTFLEDRIGFYDAAILQLLERRRYDEAFELLERSRSRALADLLASENLGFGRPDEQNLYRETMDVRARIADSQSRLFDLTIQPNVGTNGSQISALQGEIRTLETQHQKVAARMAIETPRLQNLLAPALVSLKVLQAAMREERFELLQYQVLEHAVIVWHIAPDSVSVRNVFLPRSEVIGKVAALQKSLADPNARFDETTARELFLFLIAPVLNGVRSDRLVVIPDEELQYVPFQVLQNPAGGRFLGESFQVTYAPSASILLGLKRFVGRPGGRLLAVADPDLTGARREVGAIAKLFPTPKVVIDELPRKGDIKTWIRDFDVIHLSVHGKFNGAEPMRSYLSFARGASDDGRLTAAEMFSLPLEQSSVVVLSACEIGPLEPTHGNEILGMVRALIYAGAGSLVLSYWNVDSAATALWMQTLYEAARSQPMHEASRVALLKVKNDPAYGHPYYWAAFATIGR